MKVRCTMHARPTQCTPIYVPTHPRLLQALLHTHNLTSAALFNKSTELQKLRNTEKAMINFLSMLASDYKDQFPEVPVAAIASRIEVRKNTQKKTRRNNKNHLHKYQLLWRMLAAVSDFSLKSQPPACFSLVSTLSLSHSIAFVPFFLFLFLSLLFLLPYNLYPWHHLPFDLHEALFTRVGFQHTPIQSYILSFIYISSLFCVSSHFQTHTHLCLLFLLGLGLLCQTPEIWSCFGIHDKLANNDKCDTFWMR